MRIFVAPRVTSCCFASLPLCRKPLVTLATSTHNIWSTMSDEDRLDTWKDRWNRGALGWHLSDINFALKNHSHKLLPKSNCRVLVPLCGKTVDLEWLYREGHTVVGVEAVEQGITEFFSEHNLPYITEQLSWAKVFKTEDNRLKIYCCDLFKIDVESLGKFDAVWDRGSLVAIYEHDRERYSELMKSLLAPEFRYLVNITQYTPNEKFSGPPRNVPTKLVQNLFGDKCELQVQETRSRAKETLTHWNLESLEEVVVLLTPRV